MDESGRVPIDYLRTQLRGVALLRTLDDTVLDAIAERVKVDDHEPGAVVLTQGDDAAGMFMVLRGTASVERDGEPIAVVGPGESIGEIALLDGQPRMASVRAQEDLRTGFLTSQDFLDLLESWPEVALELLISLAGRLRLLEEQLDDAD